MWGGVKWELDHASSLFEELGTSLFWKFACNSPPVCFPKSSSLREERETSWKIEILRKFLPQRACPPTPSNSGCSHLWSRREQGTPCLICQKVQARRGTHIWELVWMFITSPHSLQSPHVSPVGRSLRRWSLFECPGNTMVCSFQRSMSKPKCQPGLVWLQNFTYNLTPEFDPWHCEWSLNITISKSWALLVWPQKLKLMLKTIQKKWCWRNGTKQRA